jgi:non-canonical (house-cleaning) NTP pyrophosphatase
MIWTIAVGSTSRRKIEAVARALAILRPHHHDTVFGTEAASGVPETPWDVEIVTGARNRADAAQRGVPEADLWIGLETGLVSRLQISDAGGIVFEETWCCIRATDKDGVSTPEALAYSSGVRVPEWVLEKMREMNLAHCDAMTAIEHERGLPDDTLATYTNGLLTRDAALQEAARNALASLLSRREAL